MEICKQQRELEISSMQIVGVTQRYASSKARLKCATESAMSAMGLRVAVATFFMVHPEK